VLIIFGPLHFFIWAFSNAEIHDWFTIQTVIPSGEVAAFRTWRLDVAFPAKFPI
jgi:hypothetical protein